MWSTTSVSPQNPMAMEVEGLTREGLVDVDSIMARIESSKVRNLGLEFQSNNTTQIFFFPIIAIHEKLYHR
jgi:hypothetical protein